MMTIKMDKFTSNLSYLCSSVFALFGALSRDDWAFIIGIVTAILTCLINWWYRRRDANHKERTREMHYKELRAKYHEGDNEANNDDL
ncbi:phage holin [Orbus mooreae]|uniref:phage holin n=1 Tax=Orbus mooreae TaxID=3074107 RepID=UPI00370D737E